MLSSVWDPWDSHVADTYISKQVRRSNRNLVLAQCAILIGVGVFVLLNWRYVYNFIAGPFPADKDQLATIADPDKSLRYFFSINGDKSFESGLTEVERETNTGRETTKAHYVLLTMGDKLLVVKASPGDSGWHFDGGLEQLRSDVRSQVEAPFVEQYPESLRMFLPTMLDATGFRNDGFWALAVCVPLVGIAVWYLRVALMRRRQPSRHPIVAWLSSFGDLNQLVSIDAEFLGATKIGKATTTASWIFVPTIFGLKVARIEGLTWVYEKVTRHYHTFIPTGKTYAAVLWDRSGRALEIDGRKKKVEQLVNVVLDRAPWVAVGFNNDLEQLSKSDWAGFVSAVDQRRLGATKPRTLL
jgi:hypothetical protein